MPKLNHAKVAIGAQREGGESKIGGIESAKGYLMKGTVE